MSKNKKRRKAKKPSSNKPDLKKNLKKINWKIITKLLLIFAAVFGVYQFCIKLSEYYGIFLIQEIMLTVYYIATTVIACVFVVLNRGISNDIPTPEQLPSDWSKEKKEEFILKYTASDTMYLFYFN